MLKTRSPLLRGGVHLLCTLLAALLLWSPAIAGVSADASKKVDALYEKFEQLIKMRRTAGQMPRLESPTDAELLNAFWNPALVGEPPYAAADSEALMAILAKQRTVLGAYVFFTPDPSARAPFLDNIVTYQDEIVRAQIVQLKIIGALAAVTTDVTVLLQDRQLEDVKRSGISSFKVGYAPFLTNIGEMLAMPQLQTANRSALAKTLTENLPLIAPVLSQRDRFKIATKLKVSQMLLPEPDRPEIDTVLARFLSLPCTGFCAIR